MAIETPAPRPAPRGMRFTIWLSNAVYLIILLIFVGAGVFLWPLIWSQARASLGLSTSPAPLVAPTTATPPNLARPPISAPHKPAGDVVAPIPGIAQNSATADAMYQEAIDAANVAPLPNVGQDASAPVIAVELPSSRTHDVENAPTAEPLSQSVSDEQTGEKRVVVNIQETQQCRHGQVWTDGKGCRNPTPVR